MKIIQKNEKESVEKVLHSQFSCMRILYKLSINTASNTTSPPH